MDQVIDEWPVVFVNRVHLGLMAAVMYKVVEGLYFGELSAMYWFTVPDSNYREVLANGSVMGGLHVLLGYSIWAIIDLVVYFRHHPTLLWTLNCVHHVFRIFLIASTVNVRLLCFWTVLCMMTYTVSCACLYLKIGLLVDGKRAGRPFRLLARYSFFASILTRLVGYFGAVYWNYTDSLRRHPLLGSLLFSVYVLFDGGYLTFHYLPHKDGEQSYQSRDAKTGKDERPPESSEYGVKDGRRVSSSEGQGESTGVLKDAADRIVFYPIGSALVAPLRSLGFTPNMVTVLSGVCQIAGLWVFTSDNTPKGKIVVLLALFVGYVLDCTDGQMARRYGLVSEFGAILDTGKDAIVFVVYLAAVYWLCDWRAFACLAALAFGTVARGGLESDQLPFKLAYRFVSFLPSLLRAVLLSCHGGFFTIALIAAVCVC